MKLHHRIHKHLKQHHRKYIGGLFAGFALVKTFILLAGFFGLAGLVNTFAAEPEDTIIAQYYGEESTYTANRTSNDCDTGSMVVEYISHGTDTTPENLSGDTIYVLLPGSHITSRMINLASCSALIGSGNVRLYSNTGLQAMLYANNSKNTIIDHIKIDGYNNGNRGSHDKNANGILLESETNNSTIYNVQIHNNEYYGLLMRYSGHNNTIDKVQSYNNYYGLSLDRYSNNNSIENTQIYNNTLRGFFLQNGSNNNIINNVQSYNNSDGIHIIDSQNNTVNNSQTYNNFHGIYVGNFNAQYNTINNCRTYNNIYGIKLNDTSYNIINNTQIYYNSYGIDNTLAGNSYYGTINLFGNTSHFRTEVPLIQGSDTEFFSGGEIEYTGSMSCNHITNPVNDKVALLQDINSCIEKGIIGAWTGNTVGYIYGTDIMKQTPALQDTGIGANSYSWSTLNWDADKLVAEFNSFISGSVLIASGEIYTIDRNIVIQLTVAEPVDYIIEGDFEESPIAGTLTDAETKEITLTTGYGTKDIWVTYSTGERERPIINTFGYVDPNGLPYLYFGYGSSHTQYWTGNTCDLNRMNIIDISPGTDTIPHQLSEDTLYVLGSGDYTVTTDYIYPSHCSALIGSGDVTLYSDGHFSRIIFFSYVTNNIVDNVNVDGIHYSNGDTHGPNFAGIQVYDSSNNTISNSRSFSNSFGIVLEGSTNNTISNAQAYDNSDGGIYATNASYNTITDVKSYNNYIGFNISSSSNYNILSGAQTYNNSHIGLYLNASSHNIITNTQSYNNASQGMYLYLNSNNNIVDNSQIYNNSNHGFLLEGSCNNNTVNNTQIYNNLYGLFLQSVYDTTLYNSQIYNNAGDGITIHYSPATIVNSDIYNNAAGIDMYPSGPREMKYYGVINVFGNTTDISADQLTAGSESEIFSGGVLKTEGTISCDWVTNPMNTNNIFLVDVVEYPSCDFRGKNSTRSGNEMSYLYGTNIRTQKQVLQDSGTVGNPIYSWSSLSFDTKSYIAETNTLLNGSLMLASGQSYSLNTGVQVQLTVTEPADYVLAGDFEESPLTGTLTDDESEIKDITLTTGYGIKYITVTYSTGSRNRTLNKTIRYPDPEGLPFTYFGSGSLYTKHRETNTCNPAAMTIEYLSPGTNSIPDHLSGNTLYVLLSGSYVITTDGNGIRMANCSALIGSGDVTIYSEYTIYSILLLSDITNTIIDNVSIDSQHDGNGQAHFLTNQGISLDGVSNTTINAVETYNNDYFGIVISDSLYTTVTNSQAYNNRRDGIYLHNNANYNIINNVQTYNNRRNGINFTEAYQNTINNTQTYNNDDAGIYFYYYSTGNIINNVQSYNNYDGIAFTYHSSDTTINNLQSYNNRSYGIYIDNSTNTTYYGTMKLFGNEENLNNMDIITAGSKSEPFSGGTLDQEGIMSCDRVTNPINNEGTFLVDEEVYPDCYGERTADWSASSNTQYLYGENILKQTHPLDQVIIDDEIIFSQSSLSFDPSKYIAEINPTLNGSLSLAGGQSYLLGSGLEIQLATNELVEYILSGDFVGSPVTGTLNGATTGTVYLTGGYGIKSIMVTYSTGTKERIIIKNIGYISSLNGYCDLITDISYGECNALITLYNSTNGSGWYDKDSRFGAGDTTPTTACDWEGIYCDEGEGGKYIYYISLSNNNLSGIIPSQINNITNLEYFYAEENTITSIEPGAFSGLTDLYEIYLGYNQITTIASGTFYNLPDLEYLYINDNLIASIASGAFIDLPNIYRLSLSNNKMTTIENSVFTIPYLYYLNLSYNEIESIESGAFTDLSNLVYLYLGNNTMSAINKNSFYGLSNLNYLYLSSNHITHLESGDFDGLPNLSEVYLSDNQIANIESGTFSELPNLEYLYLDNNEITSISPGIFDGLADLYQMNLSYNEASDIVSGSFSGLSSLQNLYITNNLMVTLQPDTFNGLTNLNYLDLSNNQISTIENLAFSGLSNLQYLYLGGNFLTTILPSMFDRMENLNYLNLSFNTINNIDSGAFDGLPQLQQLFVNYNQLSGSLDNLCSFTNLHLLYADHNQFIGDIPSCLMGIDLYRGGNIAYNYLDTDVEDPSDLLNYLNSYLGGWQNQYLLADISLSGNIFPLSGNSFALTLVYLNLGPKSTDNTTIYYDMIDGLDITADTEFTTGTTATTYPGFDDPCLTEWYNSGTGPYQEFFDEYARDYDEYESLAELLCDREGFYCGSNDGVGKYLIDYIIDDDGPITDRREAFMDRFDDEDADIGNIPNCGVPGKGIYIFDLGTLEANASGTILITGTFSDELIESGPIINSLEIFSPYELRGDDHIRNNRFGFTYDEGDITINDTTSLFTDLPDSAAIITDTISLTDVVGNTGGISIRSDNIEAYLPSRLRITTSGESCDLATLLPPQDKTAEIKALDPAITAAFKIGSACSGTTLIFNRPIRIRIYIPTVLGDTNVVKISRDGLIRENVTGTKIDDHIIEIQTTHFSYFKITSSTTVDDNNDNPPTGGGGGGAGPVKDVCPAQRDCSDSYYDRICGPCLEDTKFTPKNIHKDTGSIVGSNFSTELNNAYQWAYRYDITTMPTIQKANMEGKLLRKDMAKMISNFAINIMKKDVATGILCEFEDMAKLPKETQYYAIAACRLGLMGYESDGKRTKHIFDPNAEVDRAQFGTILSRLLRGDKNNGGDIYYQKHLNALKQAGIMTKINKPNSKELRGYVMLMMMRAAE